MTTQAYDYGDETKSTMGLGGQKKPVSMRFPVKMVSLIR
jgi:hypothetical protein